MNKMMKIVSRRQVEPVVKAAATVSIPKRDMSAHLKAFATVDPENLSPKDKCMNLVGGEWHETASYRTLVDPMTGKDMI